ncbi:Endonuclease/exonuclease/phosphatase [Syncephalis plumigaleata]|nr:Endonuclease/exonuclease/phosphatase [Syncephalis plumigaleata]
MPPTSPIDMGAAYRSLVLAPGVLASDRLAIDSTRRITIMSYNILAQCLVRREMFPYCDKKSLKGSFRRENITHELRHYQPDIACLQEVDEYELYYRDVFRRAGYDSIYEGGRKRHGCCILWRRDRFVRHDYQSIQFDSTQHPPATTNTRCIGQLLALRLRTDLDDALGLDQLSLEDRSSLEAGKKPERKRGVIVTNHHLYWPPNAMYERMRQGWIMRQQLIRFKQKHAFPAFMCGDFNSIPTSPLYRLITGKPLEPDNHKELEVIPTSYVVNENANVVAPSAHPNPDQVEFKPYTEFVNDYEEMPPCRSAYADYTTLHPELASTEWKGEARFTNYAVWKGTLDYIMQVMDEESKNVKLLQLLRLPNEDMCKPGLPNRVYSSDHLCIMAEYALSPELTT